MRPQFVKAAVLSPIIRKEHKEILIHTGQHYDDNMSAVFFRELDLPKPDYQLQTSYGVNDENPAKVECMTSAIVAILQNASVDAVLVYGDTNSTLAGALAAKRLKIPTIHVEAGERNGLGNNTEERIRKTVDHLSSLLLCSSRQAMENLQAEALGDRAHYIGNLMEISFLKNIHKPWKPRLKILGACADRGTKFGSGSSSNSADLTSKNTDRLSASYLFCQNEITIPDKYYFLTCHRQENANERNLTEILLAMEQAKYPVIFPVHPRNMERVIKIYGELLRSKVRGQAVDNCLVNCVGEKCIVSPGSSNIIMTDPVGYFDSIHLIKNAEMVITDSGGVLQEAHFARVPYVFVMDIDRVPDNTRFDVSRLARPRCQEIVAKVKEHQEFAINQVETVHLEVFEDQVLQILRRFEKQI